MKYSWTNLLTLNCKTATALVEKRAAVGLNLWEALRLRLHLRICRACVDYEQSSALMEKWLHQAHQPEGPASRTEPTEKLTDNERQALLDFLKRNR